MAEFSSGKTRVISRQAPPGSTTQVVPEFAGGGVGQITHTRYIRGPAGEAPPEESVTLAYDVDGKLVTVTKPSGVTTLSYDVDEKLSLVETPDYIKTLAYNGSDQLISVTVS